MHARSTILRRPAPGLPRFSLLAALDWLASLDARYRQRMDLQALDDHMLRDIGITRSEVDGELRRPFYR
jgi:uncharacterized protein YjiS (DUF1127 family)